MHIILQNGFDAARKNFKAGLLLQGLALTLVLLYYFYPPFQEMLQQVPMLKKRMGMTFPIVVTSFCGGFIPYLVLVARGEIQRGAYWANLIFLLGLWAFLGIAVDTLYTFQAQMFGDQPDAATVVKKVLFDQLVFSPFFSAPVSTLAMHWKHCDFSFRVTREKFSHRIFTVELPSVVIAIWAVWIPTVAIVYSLPAALQFPMFNIVLCFWSLLLTALNTRK